MPCHAAITDKSVILKLDQNIDQALKDMRKRKVEVAAVVNEDDQFEGTLTTREILKNLLPVSVSMADGTTLENITLSAAPGIAKRLKKVKPLKVSQLTNTQVQPVSPQTPLWEGVTLLVQSDDPIPVVDQGSGKFLGFITDQSMLQELEKLQND